MVSSNIKERVSCLCVTRGIFLSNAIEQFKKQTHPNRELVVVYQGFLSAQQSRELEEVKAVVVEADPQLKLGALRDASLTHASGNWVCQWDDDDVFSRRRIEIQLASAVNSRSKACFLSQWYMQDVSRNELYMGFSRVWEGSMLARKNEVRNIGYDHGLSRGEDTAVARELVKDSIMSMFPGLYLYRYHGGNTWDRQHFEGLFGRSKKLTLVEASQVLAEFAR